MWPLDGAVLEKFHRADPYMVVAETRSQAKGLVLVKQIAHQGEIGSQAQFVFRRQLPVCLYHQGTCPLHANGGVVN